MPTFEFQRDDGRRFELEAPTREAAVAAWASTQQQGSGAGDFGKGFAQGAAQDVLQLGSVMTPGGPAAARFIGRAIRNNDPTGMVKKADEWINAPSKSGAQTAGRVTAEALPAFAPIGTPASALGALASRASGPVARGLVHGVAHHLGGRGVYRLLNRGGLLDLAGQWLANHPGFTNMMEDFGRGVERTGIAGERGREAATRGDDDDKDRKRGPEKPRKPPVQSNRPAVARPRERGRDNIPATADRFDQRWQGSQDLQ